MNNETKTDLPVAGPIQKLTRLLAAPIIEPSQRAARIQAVERDIVLVAVNSMRYSVPVSWIGRRVEVRETRDKIEIELDARHIVTHVRAVTPPFLRITLAEHRPPRGEGVKRSDRHPEEQAILQAAPEIAPYVAALKQKGRKVVALALRQLLRLLKEYPHEPFLAAVREAAQYGLYDLDRLERMILRRVAQDYFLLLGTDSEPHD